MGRLTISVDSLLKSLITRWECWQRGARTFHYSSDWPAFAGPRWEDRILNEPVTDRLHIKQGRSIGRRLFFHDDYVLCVYLKRHYYLPWYLRLLAMIFPQRAWSPGLREWKQLQWAARQGWPVPRAVAAGQWVGPGWKLMSFIATEELRDMIPLHEAIPQAAHVLSPTAFASWKNALFAELARLIAMLHQKYMFHKDLYLCHFYINESFIYNHNCEMKNNIYLIDLHRLKRHRWTARWWQVKDLAQFFFSCGLEGITPSDHKHFWCNYCEHMKIGHIMSKVLYNLIMIRVGSYIRRERRRRRQSCGSLCVTSV
jgi:heptose I phosphotransferase